MNLFQSDVLQIREFRRLWLGQAVSQFGDAVYMLLFLFMVDRLTGSAAMVGYVGALEALPYLLFGPYAGAIADRFDRRRVMLFSDIGSAVILLALSVWLAIDPTPPIAVVFVAAFLLSLVNTFFSPAKSAAIPAVVPADRLMEANSLSMATQNLMPLLGLALSASVLGLLYGLFPNLFFLTAALLNATSFLVSAACIAKLPPLRPKREETEEPKRALQEMLEGFRLIGRDRLLKVSLAMEFSLHAFIAPFMVAYIAANREWFGGKFATLAGCEATFMLAMVLTSLAIGKRKFRRPGLNYGISLLCAGLCVAAMAYSRSYPVFVFWNLLCGIALPFAILPLNTYIQLRVPDAFRGRVNSAFLMASRSVIPVSMGAAGLLLDRFGFTVIFQVMGLGMCLTTLAGLLDTGFRQAQMPETEAVVGKDRSLEENGDNAPAQGKEAYEPV